MLLIYAKGAVSGIYALCIDGRVVYVGKSRDLVNRAKLIKPVSYIATMPGIHWPGSSMSEAMSLRWKCLPHQNTKIWIALK